MNLTAYILLSGSASAAGLPLPPDPVPLGEARYQFAEGMALSVLPAAVVVLEEGEQPPLGAEPLGGRSWRVPVADAAEAIATAHALRQQPGVLSAWPDVLLPIAPAGFNDPSYGGQWYLETLQMTTLYAISLGDPSVRVAVIDSGIDIEHPDLIDAVDDPYDAWSDDDDPSPDPGEYCTSGDAICDEHGTAVSGVIAARADNNVGIVGLCPQCTLVPIKLLGEGISTNTLSADVAAFEHAIASDAAVINNSWGFTQSIPVPDTLAAVIERAETEPRGGLGAVVVFAAGNDDREIEDDELQALPTVMCISATDSYGRPTAYTNYGASVDIAAPSATVTLAPEGGVTETFGGTSAAAPVVSGVAGWALSVDPTLSAAQLRELMISTAVPSPLVTYDDNGHHDTYGFGELSAVGLLAALQGEPDTGEVPAGGCACSGGGAAGAFSVLPLLALFLRRRESRR